MIVVVMSILTTGCQSIIGNDYFVIIDDSFSIANKSAAQMALSEWENALGRDLRINSISFGSCNAGGNLYEYPEKLICVHPTNSSWLDSNGYDSDTIGLTIRYHETDSANVYIPIDRIAGKGINYSTTNFAHEFGHAMGLEHTRQGVMYWQIDIESRVVDCNDVAQWLDIRGMSDETPACPNGGSFVLYH
jgi:hypothetical protein